MNKKILSILLAALLLLGMTTGAMAEEHQHTYSAGICTYPTCGACDGTHRESDGWTELTAGMTLKNSGKYYLKNDVTQNNNYLTISESGTEVEVTLCLHGKTLTGPGFVIKIESDATLNLTDCSTTVYQGYIDAETKLWTRKTNDNPKVAGDIDCDLTGGVITGGNYGVFISRGTLNMYKGNITGNTAPNTSPDDRGSGVYVGGKSKFNMYGGSIAGNTAKYGGGVYIFDNNDVGTFNMYGGSIIGNTAKYGGGVCNGFYGKGNFTMSGGSITRNTASDEGGGVYNRGNFTMSGGSIAQNTAKLGGGIYNYDSTINMTGGSITENMANGTTDQDGKGGGVYTSHSTTTTTTSQFTMTCGSITGNTATTNGGGVYVYGNYEGSASFAPFRLEGNPVIQENTKGTNTPSNVYLDRKSNRNYVLPRIKILGKLTNETPIGVAIFGNTGKFTSSSSYADASKFQSDTTLLVTKNSDNVLELSLPIAVTGVTLNQTTLSLVEGSTAQLTPTIEPSNATNKNVTWSSSDSSVATVDNHGVVTAVAKGTATIEAKATDGSNETGTCTVTVRSANLSITAGGTTQYFESLEEAFASVTQNCVIKVEKSYAEEKDELKVDFSGSFTLDLNGKTISFNDGIEGTGIGYIRFAEESACTPTLQDSVGGGKLNAMLNLAGAYPIITSGTYISILTTPETTISGGTFVGLDDDEVEKLTSSGFSYANFAKYCGTWGLTLMGDADGGGFNSEEGAFFNLSDNLAKGYTTDRAFEIVEVVSDNGSVEYLTGFAAGTKVIKADVKFKMNVNIDYSTVEIPDSMPDELKTVEAIRAALEAKLSTLGLVEPGNLLCDVTLMFSNDGGHTWVEADASDFPAGGRLTVTLPVPEGTHPDKHVYTVVHMFTTDAFGKKAGDVEVPAVTIVRDEKGNPMLSFNVTGLSPIMVAWTEKQDTGVLPQTGDSSNLALWLMLMGLAGAGMYLLRKRAYN